jgi:hypothetical protein
MVVIANGMRHRAKGAIASALGIGAGSFLHATLAAVGVSAVIAASPIAFDVMKFAGATLGTNDKERSAKFYDAVFGAIGFSRLPKPPEKPLAYERGGQMPTIYIYTPEDGRPATWGNGTHVAFIADTKIRFTRSMNMPSN